MQRECDVLYIIVVQSIVQQYVPGTIIGPLTITVPGYRTMINDYNRVPRYSTVTVQSRGCIVYSVLYSIVGDVIEVVYKYNHALGSICCRSLTGSQRVGVCHWLTSQAQVETISFGA